MFRNLLLPLCTLVIASASIAHAEEGFDRARKAILSLSGCYLVDYSYAETESLKEGYKLDSRVYDVNRDKTVKEWIFPVDDGKNHIRLQHVLFSTDLDGKMNEGTLMRHQAEDWVYEAPFLYDFVGNSRWEPISLAAGSGKWVRKITNLDDGLRHQCAAPWKTDGEYSEWQCSGFSPIPGRETRDMGRKDYNTLQRTTRVIAYGNTWLERQDNVKTIFSQGIRTPLARETGKNWYVRLPDSECAEAAQWSGEHYPFWELLQKVWAETLDGNGPFIETPPIGGVPRFVRIGEIEDRSFNQIQSEPKVAELARKQILEIIRQYRVIAR